MKRLILVCLMLLCLGAICGLAEEHNQPLSSPNCIVDGNADMEYVFDNFIIIEKGGKYGLADPDGKMVLPMEYFIPVDQFDLEEQPEPVCIEIYLPTDGDYDVRDPDWELYNGTLKAGFFHMESLYFSQCIWKDVFVSYGYAAVCYDENHWSLLNAVTGEAIIEGDQYAWIDPFVSEGWFYVWLWPEEIDGDIGPIWEPVYINLDGTILTAPDGYRFSEEPEPIENGMVVVFDEQNMETSMSIEDILRKD